MVIMLPLRCMAWLLVFSSLSTGVPVSPTNDTTTSSPGIVTTISVVGVTLPNTTTISNVSVTALNNTQNATNTTSASPVLTSTDDGTAETLEELQKDDAMEGDILLVDDRNAVNTLWSDGIVPYTISPELASRWMDIEAAFRMIMSVTCIRFVQHTNELNYIELKNGEGCASFVGCNGGAQPVYFGKTCSTGNLCHELLHALGLHHEHTRHDRDDYVIVNWESIVPDRQNNFKVKKGNTLNLPYDLESIMHYGFTFFSVDGGQTLQPREPGVEIGQRTRLTQLDAKKLNRLYHCGGK
ncbi:high choriolytic enzyme 1-like isoform X2 [Melanotaenia boesemani]|uniref:high choriolytic enzyme 1-like isoform X2 n=1 Tax=Melanotaenia boesemani TaxID=1250792 RepID=UPI001C03DF9C|nr:high choriolytic enzyme 1-like isoform X2 [Melanotaenia boesemani]